MQLGGEGWEMRRAWLEVRPAAAEEAEEEEEAAEEEEAEEE